MIEILIEFISRQIKKVLSVNISKRMINAESEEDRLEFEMSALMYQAMHLRLTSIIEWVGENLVHPRVRENCLNTQQLIPNPQLLLSQTLKANSELAGAGGDISKLKAIQQRYSHLLG